MDLDRLTKWLIKNGNSGRVTGYTETDRGQKVLLYCMNEKGDYQKIFFGPLTMLEDELKFYRI